MNEAEEDSCTHLLKYARGSHNSSYKFQESPEHSWAQKRILTDLKEIQNDNMLNIEVDLTEDSIYMWDITFPAPNGKSVKAALHFDPKYPFLPPRMFIKQRLFHPNISTKGEVCLQDLKKIWTPAHCIWSLILSVQSLLSDPNPNDPINAVAANMLLKTPETYHSYALKCFELLDFFGDDEGEEDCEKKDENNSLTHVEPKDCQESNDKGLYKNDENNTIEKVQPVQPKHYLKLRFGALFQNDNSLMDVEPDNLQELNDDAIFEEDIFMQHVLLNTFPN